MPRERRRISRISPIAVTVVLALIYLANLPFYSGSALPWNLSYRLEHGRLKVERRPTPSSESFYIAANSEGLRFAWDAHYDSLNNWSVNIPLWAPLSLSLLWTVAAWLPARRSPGACRSCGYPRAGLPVAASCPECGPSPRHPPPTS